MWQFLCDSLYDLFHLTENGYTDLIDWWTTRVFEWNCLLDGSNEAFNKQDEEVK